MTPIDQYLTALRATLGSLPRDEQEAILVEIRDHLEQESERLRNLSPSMEPDAAMAEAIDSFGPAEEIAVAYGADHEKLGIINQRTGERLLDVAIVTGRLAGKVVSTGARGLRGILKYGGIGALAILGVATILAVAGLIFAGTVITVFDDEIKEAIPRPLHGTHQSWASDDPQTMTRTDRFYVQDDVKEFWIDLSISSNSGCGSIELLDPAGNVAYNSGNVCDEAHSSGERRFTEQGEWQVRYTLVAFTGWTDVEAWYFQSAS